jgi:hypothetical protein
VRCEFREPSFQRQPRLRFPPLAACAVMRVPSKPTVAQTEVDGDDRIVSLELPATRGLPGNGTGWQTRGNSLNPGSFSTLWGSDGTITNQWATQTLFEWMKIPEIRPEQRYVRILRRTRHEDRSSRKTNPPFNRRVVDPCMHGSELEAGEQRF